MPFPAFVAISMALAAGTMAAAARLSGRPERAALAALCGAGALVLFHGLGWLNFVVDDAYINFRYSRHLADGLGPNWNDSGRVEGYTNFLWMALVAGIAKLGFSIVVSSRVLGFLAVVATLLLTYRTWRLWADEEAGSAVESPLVLAAAVVGLGLTGGVAFYGFSGLETPLFMALVTAGAYLHFLERRRGGGAWSAVALAAAAMTRPDGLIAAAVTGLFKLASLRDAAERRRAAGQLALWTAVFLALWGSYFVWRYAYYDHLLPNTFYAKVSGTAASLNGGVDYLRGIGLRYHFLPLLVGAAVLLARARIRPDVAYIIALSAATFAAVVVEGGDFMGHGRFVLPVLPLLYLAGLAGFATLLKRMELRPLEAGLVASGALVLAALTLLQNSDDALIDQERASYEERRVLGAWLNEHAPPDSTIAAFAVGALGYYADDRAFLDLLGINNVTIAHTDVEDAGEGVPGHEKYNLDYVFDVARPEIIVAAELAGGPLTEEELATLSREATYLAPRNALLADRRLSEQYDVRWLVLGERWVNLLQRNDAPALDGPGIVLEQNFLRDAGSPLGWQTYQSTIEAAAGELLVSSDQAGYGPYQRTLEADVRPGVGQTFAVLVWVRGTATSTGDQISISVRENGVHSPETETNGFFQLTESWQPVWVTHTVTGSGATFLSVHLLKLSEQPKEDSFLFRDAQLRLLAE